jgi:hypothetical protein
MMSGFRITYLVDQVLTRLSSATIASARTCWEQGRSF